MIGKYGGRGVSSWNRIRRGQIRKGLEVKGRSLPNGTRKGTHHYVTRKYQLLSLAWDGSRDFLCYIVHLEVLACS